MPLHLLGKKSWNVYNTDNIARVKRDEAEAAAREEADDQRMQEIDAERRLQVLRGLPVEDVLPASEKEQQQSNRERSSRHDAHGRERKRRRIAGEDDTERDIRYAQENATSASGSKELQLISKKSSDAPLTDHKGNINLFPAEGPKHKPQKNAEVEAEKKRKEKDFEDQYTMRFSNAAGFKQSVGEKPWYHSLGTEKIIEAPSKDVWGNEDPTRRERQTMRVAADDPLAMIQKGVAGVREAEKERRRWKEEKAKEIRALDDDQRREKRMKRSRRDIDELDEFRLDADDRSQKARREREKPSKHSQRHRSRSRERDRHRHKHGARLGHGADHDRRYE